MSSDGSGPGWHDALGRALGSPVRGARGVSGGDINDAHHLTLEDGRQLFAKSNRRAPPTMFPAEARGLAFLAEPGVLRVPRVLAVSDATEPDPGRAFLALELIQPAPRRQPDFDERLGRGLAALHRATPRPADPATPFGLDHDNFIGRLPQDNTPAATWADFYRARRLEPQLRRAVDAGLASPSMRRDLPRLLERLPVLVGPPEPPARLHGDLWGGNLLVDDTGAPCLIDPAVQAGHRELDLGMMRLFGGFAPRVFAAYQEAAPLAPGADERVPLYQLYFLLVHVNLFGGSYVASVEQALASLL